MSELEDYYGLLGLSVEASAAEVKAAWRRESFVSHPDLSAGDEAKSERFLKLGEARATLLDKKKRAAYDRRWRRVYGPLEFADEPESPLASAVEAAARGDEDAEVVGPDPTLPGRELRAEVDALARKLAEGDLPAGRAVRRDLALAILCGAGALAIALFPGTFPSPSFKGSAVILAASLLVFLARARARRERCVEGHREMARTLVRQRRRSQGGVGSSFRRNGQDL